MNTTKAPSRGARQLVLRTSSDEFMANLKAISDEEKYELPFFHGLKDKKAYVSKVDGNRFRIARRQKLWIANLARVLHGQLEETADGTLLRYYLAVRKEKKAVLAFSCAVYSMFFLFWLYVHPPATGNELAYFIPLILPGLGALLLLSSIASGRANESELLDLVSKLDRVPDS